MQVIEVRQITAAETILIRHAVLRQGQPLEDSSFPGDDEPNSVHLGAFRDGVLLGVASLFEEPFPGDEQPACRLRGMATALQAQGSGVGRTLLAECITRAKGKRMHMIWCNARMGALKFYERFGFESVSEVFDIPHIGPHRVMRRNLR